MPDYSDRLLLTIHGVTSDNEGLANLRTYCEQQLPGLICDSYYFGHVYPFSDLNETIRQTIFNAVREKIELVYYKHLRGTGRRLYIVAHSFGTLAVTNALMVGVPDATVEALVLLGSIVPRAFQWDPLVQRGQIRTAPLAIVRPLDSVVLGGRLLGGGASGAIGFISNGVNRVRETYKNGGHTAYDPDDAQDIVTVLRAGIGEVPQTSYASWWAKCGTMTRWRVKLGRFFKG